MKNSESRFVNIYIEKTIRYGLNPGAARWGVKHVEAYINHYSGHKLALHSASDVDNYLNMSSVKGALAPWQFKQIVDSLRILFCGFYKTGLSNGLYELGGAIKHSLHELLFKPGQTEPKRLGRGG